VRKSVRLKSQYMSIPTQMIEESMYTINATMSLPVMEMKPKTGENLLLILMNLKTTKSQKTGGETDIAQLTIQSNKRRKPPLLNQSSLNKLLQ
jgi:hypothetical protein